jgi:hypothetical protein
MGDGEMRTRGHGHLDPVALHAVDQAQGRHAHVVGLLPKLQLVREPHNEQRRVHNGQLDAQLATELEIDGAKNEDVDLESRRDLRQTCRWSEKSKSMWEVCCLRHSI